MFLLVILAFIVGVIVGAFSHKWLAAEATKAGVNPQAVADKVNATVKKL